MNSHLLLPLVGVVVGVWVWVWVWVWECECVLLYRNSHLLLLLV